MRTISGKHLGLLVTGLLGISITIPRIQAQKPDAGPRPAIPRTWDDAAMATLEVSLADPVGSPKHASADYYYKIPIRPIYKSYPAHAPGQEPPGYIEWLNQQEPVLVWGDANGKRAEPPLKTESDWIKAGEIVFDSPIMFAPLLSGETAIEMNRVGPMPLTAAGVDPFDNYVIREKGKVEVAFGGCSDCHIRVMGDGSVIRGGQGNKPIDHFIAFLLRGQFEAAKDKQPFLAFTRLGERALFEVPWLKLSDQPDYNRMSLEEIAATHAAIPPGLFARERTSALYPPHIPDLIGAKDRRYLDATGLQQHRSIGDLMRYAALNQGGDDLASYDGFIPADLPNFKKLPDPARQSRYSDEQLYALALYIYSLQPPPNPNKFDALAARGKEVFNEEGCARCHTPPLYTNNKLTPAQGFTPPPDAFKTYSILHESVGTDPNLALKTRRGTGYYKVPSLKGIWYRSMFSHDGSCATLEDWFDPKRLNDDYVPTGFKGYGVKSRAVKGHEFGLDLSEEDRKALIAFLKTL